MYWGNHFWGMHLFWWIFWVVLVAALVYWLVPTERTRPDSAVEVLRRSYAAGEIGEEDYRRRLAVLGEGGQRSLPADKRAKQKGEGHAAHAP